MYWAPGIYGASGATGYYCYEAACSLYWLRRLFMFRKKITLIIALAASVLMLASISFTPNTGTPDLFPMQSSVEAASLPSYLIKTEVDIKVNDLAVAGIDSNLDEASAAVYSENTKTAAVQEVETAVVELSATGANFSSLEAEIAALVNAKRAEYGLSQLAADQTLTDLARLRSNDMINRGYFSHYTPDGQNITHILAEYGVNYRNFGENLGNATPAGYGTPQAFLNAWMNSASHRANMLKDYYTTIGVGVTDGGGRRVVTVLFIR